MMGFKVRKLSDIKIGHTTNINPNCMFDSRGGEIQIGDYVDIAPEVNIWTLEHDPQDPDFATKGGGVIIGDLLCRLVTGRLFYQNYISVKARSLLQAQWLQKMLRHGQL